MSAELEPDLPGSETGNGHVPKHWIDHLIYRVAVGGGVLALVLAMLVSASVLGRWLLNAPIDGDFEFVKIGTAIAVFCYLPYTQAQRGNIMVDTFTMWMRPGTRAMTDGFWDVAYAGFAVLMAYGLAIGTMEAFRSGETTMQRQLLVWPAIAFCCLMSGLLVISALLSAVRRIGKEAMIGSES